MKRKVLLFFTSLVCLFFCVPTAYANDTDATEQESTQAKSDTTTFASAPSYTNDLKDHPQNVGPPYYDDFPEEYSFMPRINSETEVSIYGNYNLYHSTDIEFDLTENTKGAAGVLYKNIGTYNDKIIDLKITIEDWELGSSPYFVRFFSQNLDIDHSNAKVKLKYEYFEHETTTPIEISGFHNFSGIDNLQSIRIYDNMHVMQYYTTDDCLLSYYETADYIQIGSTDTDTYFTYDSKIRFGFTYKSTSSYTLLFDDNGYGYGCIYYNYEKEASPRRIVTVNYVDTEGNTLAPSITISGFLGNYYYASAINISGYSLTAIPDNATGVYTKQPQSVTFVYKSNSIETETETQTESEIETTVETEAETTVETETTIQTDSETKATIESETATKGGSETKAPTELDPSTPMTDDTTNLLGFFILSGISLVGIYISSKKR